MSTNGYALLRVIKELRAGRGQLLANVRNASKQGVGTKMGTVLNDEQSPVIGTRRYFRLTRAEERRHTKITVGGRELRALVEISHFAIGQSVLADRTVA